MDGKTDKLLVLHAMPSEEHSLRSFRFIAGLRSMVGRTGWDGLGWHCMLLRMLLHHGLGIATTGSTSMLVRELMMLMR
jgi:hypothetical protein